MGGIKIWVRAVKHTEQSSYLWVNPQLKYCIWLEQMPWENTAQLNRDWEKSNQIIWGVENGANRKDWNNMNWEERGVCNLQKKNWKA